MNPLVLLGLGLVLGMRHAADPDHVVAVSAIAARTRSVLGAARLGVIWGLGHTLTLCAAGAAIILFNLVLPPRVGLTLELAVAIALVVVGLLNIRPQAPAAASADGPRLPARRAFLVGLVHGLAGSAAVALLVLAAVRDTWWACGYLLLFGFGTVAGMALITTAVASPLRAASSRWTGFGPGLRFATGALSLVFGAWLVVQIGWHDGLFLAVPHWTPR